MAGFVNAGEARREAHDVLAQARFEHDSGDGDVVDAIEELVRPIRDFLDGASPDGDLSLGIPLGFFVAVLVAAAALAAVAASRAVQRRLEVGRWHGRREGAVRSPAGDLKIVERAASEAEARGDFALAIRLRFRAGLIRLAERGAIRLRPSLTVRQAAGEVRSPTLDRLAVHFESVAYGGRSASADDVTSTRHAWSDLLEEVGKG